jgi:hypothetical protein
VVFKTHFDLGYTDSAKNVIEKYRTTMIDKALDVCDSTKDLPPEHRFVWTLAGWPMAPIPMATASCCGFGNKPARTGPAACDCPRDSRPRRPSRATCAAGRKAAPLRSARSEEHTSELQSLS